MQLAGEVTPPPEHEEKKVNIKQIHKKKLGGTKQELNNEKDKKITCKKYERQTNKKMAKKK